MILKLTLIDMTHKRKDLTVTSWTDIVKHEDRRDLGNLVIIEKVIFDYILRRMKEGYVISNMEVVDKD